AQRDPGQVEAHREVLRTAAQGSSNLLPLLVDAVKAGLTLGEISDVFREVWGTHDSPA
ncbi:MAG: methylmalonyl-CoA mutase family protein, partial [Gemmatimonadota bacterium]|nr:methylmalonyl-CoA mutase family protein [Gemmatimonadota bacterium]